MGDMKDIKTTAISFPFEFGMNYLTGETYVRDMNKNATPFASNGVYFPALMEMLAEEITRIDARIDSLNRRFRRNRGY